LRTVIGDIDPSDHHMVWMDLRPQISLAEAVVDFDAAWTGSAVTLTWQASAGYQYKVQRSSTLTAGSWVDTGIIPDITLETREASVVVPASAAGKVFYRLEVSFAP
jgi:hypothetical protein